VQQEGTGATPIQNATVLIKDKRITALGPRDKVSVPAGANVIDGAGKFVTPGFIDTNVHISMYANLETLARYLPRATEVVTEGVGKIADLLVLDADSLASISNIRKLRTIVKDGRVIDPNSIPTNPIWYKAPRASQRPSSSTRVQDSRG
jgi:imidazolonepropionase-like amidohydrolase